MIKLASRIMVTRLYRAIGRLKDMAATVAFSSSVRCAGTGLTVRHPIYIRGPQYLSVGNGFSAGPGLRIEAWDNYRGTRHSPEILIGENVSVNFYVHIGAIGKLQIGDSVIIGSHVLIIDHDHGDMTCEMLTVPAKDCPLYSKGEVVIEDNVWIGEGACVLSGVRLGKNSVIGANAVVTKDVPPGCIVGGVPAQLIGNLSDNNIY